MDAEFEGNLPWLEVLLGLSAVTLLLQIFPGLFWGLVHALDVRNWSWAVIVVLNAVVVVGLIGYRAWQNREG